MKKLLFCGFAFLIGLAAHAQDEIEKVTIPISNPNEKILLEIDQVNGDITITGYDGKEVIVEANFGGMNKRNDRENRREEDCFGCPEVRVDVDISDGRRKSPPPGMKRIASSPVELRATEDDNHVQIETESWKRKINLEIMVPSLADLDIHTVHGDIEVSNVNGEHEISGVNGEIIAQNVTGSLLANTVNGSIEASFVSTTRNIMSFVTLNGDVDVLLPANTQATAKMKSDRGEIYSDFEMDIEKGRAEVRKRDGEFEVAINSWVFGKINGGGPEYTFKNMNGDIIVRKGK